MRWFIKIRFLFLWAFVFFMLLGLGEAVLRMSGKESGLVPDNAYFHIYEPLFSRVSVGDKETMLECRRFIGREDRPIEPFYEKKAPGTVRIFIVGGSVAEGMDIAGFFGLLEETSKDKAFEIINCGYAGSESFGEKLIVSEILGYSPDLIILFSGNNEYYDTNGYNHRLFALNRYLRSFRLWCLFQDGLYRLFPLLEKKPSRTWAERHKDFEDNISSIAKQTKAAGVPLLMCTMPANIRDNAPVGELPLSNEDFLRAYLSLDFGYIEDAAVLFARLEKQLPQNPFIFYFAARTQEKLGNFKEARRLYVKAQEYDFPHNHETRATASINNIIRRVCGSYGAELADLDKSCAMVSEHGIAGLDLLVDSCHWRRGTEEIVRRTILKAMVDSVNPIWTVKAVAGQFDITVPVSSHEKEVRQLRKRMELLFELIEKENRDAWSEWDMMFDDSFLTVYRLFDMAEDELRHACVVSGYEWLFRKYPEIFDDFDSFCRRVFLLSLSRGEGNGLDAVRVLLYARACRKLGRGAVAVSLLNFVLERSLAMPRELESDICIELALAYFWQGKNGQAFNCLERAQILGADVKALRRVLDSFLD